MKFIFIISLVFFTASSLTIYSNGSISKFSSFQDLSFNITAGYANIAMTFQVTNIDNSNLLAVASFSPIPNNLSLIEISNYFATSSAQLNYMDVTSVIGQNKQILNLAIPTPNTSLIYVTLFNFDLPSIQTDKTYSLILNYLVSGKICNPCTLGSSLIYDSNRPLLCQCTPCPENYVGSSCQYFLSPLVQKQGQSKDILSRKKLYFRIIDRNVNIRLSLRQLTNTNSVRLYIQYEYQEGSLAGRINCFYNKLSLSFQILVTSLNVDTVIPSNGKNILLTFENSGNSLATITLVYAPTSSSFNSFWIIFIVGGSIFGAVAFILIFCLIFRYCKNKNLIVSNESEISDQKKILQSSQINKFFPQITGESFYQQSSKASKQRSKDEPQCSICFDRITSKQILRITYCNHAFHSKCLQQWFQQTQKCPDCNQIFDISTSDELRNKMLASHSDLAETLTKSFWHQSNSSRRNPLQEKTQILSQSKSFEQIRIEDLQ